MWRKLRHLNSFSRDGLYYIYSEVEYFTASLLVGEIASSFNLFLLLNHYNFLRSLTSFVFTTVIIVLRRGFLIVRKANYSPE